MSGPSPTRPGRHGLTARTDAEPRAPAPGPRVPSSPSPPWGTSQVASTTIAAWTARNSAATSARAWWTSHQTSRARAAAPPSRTTGKSQVMRRGPPGPASPAGPTEPAGRFRGTTSRARPALPRRSSSRAHGWWPPSPGRGRRRKRPGRAFPSVPRSRAPPEGAATPLHLFHESQAASGTELLGQRVIHAGEVELRDAVAGAAPGVAVDVEQEHHRADHVHGGSREQFQGILTHRHREGFGQLDPLRLPDVQLALDPLDQQHHVRVVRGVVEVSGQGLVRDGRGQCEVHRGGAVVGVRPAQDEDAAADQAGLLGGGRALRAEFVEELLSGFHSHSTPLQGMIQAMVSSVSPAAERETRKVWPGLTFQCTGLIRALLSATPSQSHTFPSLISMAVDTRSSSIQRMPKASGGTFTSATSGDPATRKDWSKVVNRPEGNI